MDHRTDEQKQALSRAADAELERVLQLLRAPAPRVVDDALVRASRSSIATFLMYMGLGFTFFFLVQVGVVGWLVRSIDAVPLIVGLIPVLMLAATVGMFVYGLRSRRRTARLLSEGTLCKGRVAAVSPLSARINGRTFFRVRVEIQPPSGAAATAAGATTAADTVDNYAVEFFLNARDQQKEVDVLHTPDVPKVVILPAKIAFTRRFD